jgi:hypothetical protein
LEGILVPKALLSTSDEDEAAARRRRIRERLLRGEEIVVTPRGEVEVPRNVRPDQDAITVPPGKLASFYWYEREPTLLDAEKQSMKKFFPQFKLDRFSDGRLFWEGELRPDNIRPGAFWYLQAIYDNNHPHNNTYGGSVKVYAIEPDLEKLSEELEESIPHTLTDEHDHLYLCTARHEDVYADDNLVTTAASSLAWASKWIAAFELWMAGDLSTEEFSEHDGI